MKPAGFSKTQRLKSRKKIQQLFAGGKRVQFGKLKVIFLTDDSGCLQCGVGLGYKNFRHATDRNRIKRLLREAYRLQQGELINLVEKTGTGIFLFMLYTGREMPVYTEIYNDVGKALEKVITLANATIIKNS